MSKPKICLVMIVKDEENVIERCLTALKPNVDCYAIMDTGSTDETKSIIKKTMEGVRGKIYDMPFHSFAVNRSRVMSLARQDFPEMDYQLMIDADDTWTVPEDFEWPKDMTHAAYHIRHTMGGAAWTRPALMQTSMPWIYHGAAHEHIECAVRHQIGGVIEGPVIKCGSDGSRRVKEGQNKYKRIAGALEKELAKDPRNKRNVFYLAQSWRDAGDPVKAIMYYTKRAEMGGWHEEVWNAKYEIARIIERLGRPIDEIAKAYLEAYNTRPQRAESLYALAYACRRKGEFNMAFLYASAARQIPRPKDILFVNESVYTWRALDEFCVAASKIGFYEEGKEAAMQLLSNPGLPENHRPRVLANLKYCKGKLGEPVEEEK